MTGAAMGRALRKARESARDGVAQSSSARAPRELPILFQGAMMVPILNLAPGTCPPMALNDRRPFKFKTRRLSPRYHVGDRLWPRETWRTEERASDMVDGIRYRSDDAFVPIENTTAAAERWVEAHENGKHEAKWRPSIFQRRWMSRALLEVVKVEEQRLGDMPVADVLAEGLHKLTKDEGRTWKYGIPDRDGLPGNDDHGWHWHEWEVDPIVAFRKLWERVNGPGSWNDRQVVYVVEFRRIR